MRIAIASVLGVAIVAIVLGAVVLGIHLSERSAACKLRGGAYVQGYCMQVLK